MIDQELLRLCKCIVAGLVIGADCLCLGYLIRPLLIDCLCSFILGDIPEVVVVALCKRL